MPSSQRPTRTRRTRRTKLKSRLLIVFKLLAGSIALITLGLTIFVVISVAATPKWDPVLLDDQKQTSYVYDKDEVQIALLHGYENRQTVEYADIPDLVKDTFIAVEDKRFKEHIGIDPIRIIGSAINDIRTRSAKEGASTITMQLARTSFIEDPTAKKLSRKIQEAVLAIKIEREYTKEEILTFYLNKISLGASSFGIQAAAKTYFGADLEDLKPVEVALLAGLPQAPSRYNPYVNPDLAKNRRTIVLGVMRDAGIISAEEYNETKDTPFTYVETMKENRGGAEKTSVTTANYKFPYFVDYVIEELETTYNLTPEQIFSGGLRIYTTVNPTIQSTAEAAFANPANFPKGIDNTKVQGAITIIEPSTGAIQAMVGGRDYTPRGLNRAWQANRHPGSAIKPLVVYAPALEKGGYFPGSVLDDMPVSYNDGSGKPWTPTNFDTISRGWKGLITMRYAVEQSVNIYAVKLLDLIGVDYAWSFGKNNLSLPLRPEDKVLSLGLGTANLTTLDMTAAYGVFANNGVKVTPHVVVKVLDSKGNILITPKITKDRVMKETTAYLVNSMLRSVVTRGTGVSAQIGNWAVAGKTGTSSLPDYYKRTGNTDAWFAGYTPHYAGVVWMGYDSNPDLDKNRTPGPYYLRSVYGGGYPAQIWKSVMTAALKDLPVQSEFKQPSGIVSGSFDKKSGLLPSSLTPPEFIGTEIAAQGNFPTRVSNVWFQKEVDADQPTMLASEYSTNTITKTFLNLPNRNANWTWPSNESPYKPPTVTASGPIEDPDLDADPDTDLDPDIDTDLDPDTDNDTDTTPAPGTDAKPNPSKPGQTEPTATSPTLGEVTYNANSFKAVISVTVPKDNKGDALVFFVQRPGQTVLEIPIKASNASSTSITISLSNEKDKAPIPGDYVFQAAFQNRNGSGVGPLSRSVKLTLTT